MGRSVDRSVRALKLLAHDPKRSGAGRVPRLGNDHRAPEPATRTPVIDLNGIHFELDLDLDPRMRQMLEGRYQPDLLAALRRFLHEGDTFVDVGASIGYVSAYGLGLVGPTGEVHAFEPVPRYNALLQRVAEQNPSYRLRVNRVALGESGGTASIAITNLANIGWNTMVPGFMQPDSIAETIEVPVTTLDAYLLAHGGGRPRVVKIDTEGFEYPVLRGFARTPGEVADPPVLIVEIAPGAYRRFGASLEDLYGFMEALGFSAYDITLSRSVDVRTLDRTTDVVFVKGNGDSVTTELTQRAPA